MTDVIAHHVAYEEQRQQDPQRGQDEVEIAVLVYTEEQEALYMMDDELEEGREQRHRDADGETKQEDEVALADMLLPPDDEALQQRAACG